MTRIYLKIILLFAICSCSSYKKVDDTIIYTDTGGLSLIFKMASDKNGSLFINNYKDTIAFNYEVKKVYKNLINSKTKKEKKNIIYEYNICYSENKIAEYEVLKKYKTLISLKKKSIFRYESHSK